MPLLDRRARDLFKPRRHAPIGFLLTCGNLNIEEHNPPSPPMPPQFGQVPHFHLGHLEERLLSLEQKKKEINHPPGRLLGPVGAPVFSVSTAADRSGAVVRE